MIPSVYDRRILPLIYGFLLALVLGACVVESKAKRMFQQGPQTGAEVVLVRNCTQKEADNRGDGNPMYVILKGNGKTFVNDDQMEPGELIFKLAEVFSHRQAKVAYLIVDESVSYERVAMMAAGLQKATDGLDIFMPTVSQIRSSYYGCYMPPPGFWRNKFPR